MCKIICKMWTFSRSQEWKAVITMIIQACVTEVREKRNTQETIYFGGLQDKRRQRLREARAGKRRFDHMVKNRHEKGVGNRKESR